MNPNANSFNARNIQANANNPFQTIAVLNQTVAILKNELVNKDNYIRNAIIEYNILKLSTLNELNPKMRLIEELKKKNEELDIINKSLLTNLNVKNKMNENLKKEMTTVKNEFKVLKSKKLYNSTNVNLLNYIATIEDANKDFKEKIEQLEKKCEEMKKTIDEKDKELNECIDTLFIYEMKCAKFEL